MTNHPNGSKETPMNYGSNARLTRSSSDRVLGGVCGGFARWMGWDPTLVRVAYLLLTVFSAAFPGVLLYVLLWLIMPQDPVSADL